VSTTITRKHLTIADLCDELGIARSTFYDWRAKGRAPGASNSPTETYASVAPSSSAG
jgi:predicted DNA-binding transcriptional regulator AlpA